MAHLAIPLAVRFSFSILVSLSFSVMGVPEKDMLYIK
jgi:hypothetical protein